MAKTIGFIADENMRLLATALAKRLGYEDTSSMLRALLMEEINAEIPPAEQEQIIKLFQNKEGKKRNFGRTRRSGRSKAA